jgi:hypothetical protein
MFERKSNLPIAVFPLSVTKTEMTCPTGEIIGARNISEGRIPVLSCEGGCSLMVREGAANIQLCSRDMRDFLRPSTANHHEYFQSLITPLYLNEAIG